MAKVNAPLFSFGASGKLGNALVFFNWKGINAVRTWVSPSNPKSTSQVTHRGYLAACVDAIHAAQSLTLEGFAEDDKTACSLWGSIFASPRTWFNQVCKNWIDQRVAALRGAVYRAISVTPSDGQVIVRMGATPDGANRITGGNVLYGTSKTALVNTQAATITTGDAIWVTLTTYAVDDIIIEATGGPLALSFQCTAPGDSGAAEPTWPTVIGGTVVDGTVTWTAVDRTAAIIKATIASLTNGTKYYFQFRPTAHADFVGAISGIIHSTPSA